MKHIFMLWKVLMVCLLLANPLASYADFQPSYSTAGFYSLPNTGRTVYDMNPAWRFYKGKIEGAEQKNFDDKKWDIVSFGFSSSLKTFEYMIEVIMSKTTHGFVYKEYAKIVTSFGF